MPRPGGQAEDDGWVLTMVYNSGTERTELAILDAQQLSKGPVARICLPHHIPYGTSCTSTAIVFFSIMLPKCASLALVSPKSWVDTVLVRGAAGRCMLQV